MVSFQKIICIIILGLSVLGCSNVVSPNGENQGVKILKYVISVYHYDQPVNDVSLHFVDKNNQLIQQLQTDENGQLKKTTIEGVHKLYAFKPGYKISIVDSLDTKFEDFGLRYPVSLNIELVAYSQQKKFNLRTNDTSAPLSGSTVEVLFDDYPIYQIHTDFNGNVEFDYEFDHERNQIRLLTPEVGINEIELDQMLEHNSGIDIYNFKVDFPNLVSKTLTPIFSSSTMLPEHTTAINENGEQIPISDQNYIHLSISPDEKRHIRIEGAGVRDHTYTILNNNSNVHIPIFLSNMSYEPLYEINQNTVWTFRYRNSTYSSPNLRVFEYDITWNFISIEHSENTRLYTITEEVIDVKFQREPKKVNTVKIYEDEFGIWTYLEKSDSSPPLFPNNILPTENLTLTMTDGTVQPIRYAPHSRILPVNTKELKYSYATSSPPDSYPNNSSGSYILSKIGFLKAQKGSNSRGNANSVSYDLISVEN